MAAGDGFQTITLPTIAGAARRDLVDVDAGKLSLILTCGKISTDSSKVEG